jgi:hypothetical protein
MAYVLIPLQRVDRRTHRNVTEADTAAEPEEPSRPAEAFVTVSDAAGRVLFRRPATAADVEEALAAAALAEGAQALGRIMAGRLLNEALEG